jgi:hypothetical protein
MQLSHTRQNIARIQWQCSILSKMLMDGFVS